MNKTYRRIFNGFLKVGLFALIGMFVYVQVADGEKWNTTQSAFLLGFNEQRLPWLLIAFLLIFVNLAVESFKWKFLMEKVLPVTWLRAIESVLAGLAAGMITPGRIGDMGGRALLFRNKISWRAIYPAVINSLSLNLSILLFGCLAAGYFLSTGVMLSQGGIFLFAIGGLTAFGILFMLFFQLDDILKALAHLEMPMSWKKKLLVWAGAFEIFGGRILLRALFYSSIRLLIFSFQFYCLLVFFQGSIPLVPAVAAIWLIYLVQVGIPIPPVLDVFARGGIALFFLKSLQINELATLSATFSLWLLNIVLPALVGYLILFKTKYQKSSLNAPVSS